MKRWTLACCLLVAAACLVWIAVVQMPDGRLHVFFLDVAAGQGVVALTPSGRVVLIDGGPEASVLLTSLGRLLPFWQRTLHAVVATHQGTSAVLPLLDVSQRYDIIRAVGPPAGDSPSKTFMVWLAQLGRRNQAFRAVRPGDVLDAGDGVELHFLASGDDQLGVRVSFKNVDVLLPGAHPSATADSAATVVAYPAQSRLPANATPGPNVTAAILFTGRRGAPTSLPNWPAVHIFGTASDGIIELTTDGQDIQINPISQ